MQDVCPPCVAFMNQLWYMDTTEYNAV